MEIDKMISRVKWMLDDLEKAKKAGITDAEIKALFCPKQSKLAYRCGLPGQGRLKEIPLNMDYSVDLTSKKGTVTLVVHEYIN